MKKFKMPRGPEVGAQGLARDGGQQAGDCEGVPQEGVQAKFKTHLGECIEPRRPYVVMRS